MGKSDSDTMPRMQKPAAKIRFKAKLLRPATPKNATWAFFVLPKDASAKLPARGMTTVDGTLDGHAFQATLEPDGQGSHWLKVTKAMREAAGASIGDTLTLEMTPAEKQAEPSVPADLRKALAADPAAKALWSEITTVARRDWIQWITSAKKAETRERRVASACDMLASGKRRVCCFDRSGIYGKGLSAPEAAE
nr:YdeI/OmpD-associated family protein [Lysobacter alkalisoli]